MSQREIKNLKQILEKCLGGTVVEYKLANLTKPGDNYGSIIQSLEVITVDKNESVSVFFYLHLAVYYIYSMIFVKKREVFHMVVKAAVTSAYLVKVFQPSLTFVKETQFY